jgi:hypothetical protein
MLVVSRQFPIQFKQSKWYQLTFNNDVIVLRQPYPICMAKKIEIIKTHGKIYERFCKIKCVK